MGKRTSKQLELAELLNRSALPTPQSRATTRRRLAEQLPAPKPWRAVVLAVDTATQSGWAIAVEGVLDESGEVDTLSEPIVELIVGRAVELAAELRLPLVLVLETPWGGPVDTVAALGAARERWMFQWRALGQAKARVVRVMPSTWRSAVLGRAWAAARRDEVRAHEQRTAAALVGHPVGPDEAPAILIARWGAHAARVGVAIGKRAQRQSLRAWTGR